MRRQAPSHLKHFSKPWSSRESSVENDHACIESSLVFHTPSLPSCTSLMPLSDIWTCFSSTTAAPYWLIFSQISFLNAVTLDSAHVPHLLIPAQLPVSSTSSPPIYASLEPFISHFSWSIYFLLLGAVTSDLTHSIQGSYKLKWESE